ncbi:MAG: L-ribulose-5-phosphate 3-epimerase [Clostridiales bacterium]|nr:L-ribulose-5-phosphate 3-epimerase [Clostridiales bacterium]
MRDYQLGIYEKAMPNDTTWLEKLTAAKNAGFDFVEISVDESDARQARLDWTQEERMMLVNTMKVTGMPIRTMCLSGHRKYPLGSHDEATRERGMKIMEKAIDLAGDLGIRIIQLAGYDVYYEEGDEDTRKWFAENLAKCVQMAAAKGVMLGFETMETPFMDTISKSMEYVNLVNSPYLGVYPDLGNLTNAAYLYGLDVNEEIEAGRGHIVAMHIKETEEGKYRDMRFGTGRVEFVSGIAKARSLGVNCFVAECWYDGTEDWQGSIREVNDFVRAQF